MKKISWIVFASIALFIVSCSDETVDPTVDPRDKFIGNWLCQETISGTSQTFTITISKVGTDADLKITNFSNYGSTSTPQTIAEVSGNSIVIPFQNITTTGIPVQGSGIYSSSGGEKINMNYTTDGQTATAICTK